MKENWIIIAYDSEGSISVNKLFGDITEIQDAVFKMIVADRELQEQFDFFGGTKNVYDFDTCRSKGFFGYNDFYDFSIHYVAYPYPDIPEFPYPDIPELKCSVNFKERRQKYEMRNSH